MELIFAIVIGYILGIMPTIIYFLWKNKVNKKEVSNETENKNYETILTEWLYGKDEDEKKKVNQQDIFEEYITGKEAK